MSRRAVALILVILLALAALLLGMARHGSNVEGQLQSQLTREDRAMTRMELVHDVGRRDLAELGVPKTCAEALMTVRWGLHTSKMSPKEASAVMPSAAVAHPTQGRNETETRMLVAKAVQRAGGSGVTYLQDVQEIRKDNTTEIDPLVVYEWRRLGGGLTTAHMIADPVDGLALLIARAKLEIDGSNKMTGDAFVQRSVDLLTGGMSDGECSVPAPERDEAATDGALEQVAHRSR